MNISSDPKLIIEKLKEFGVNGPLLKLAEEGHFHFVDLDMKRDDSKWIELRLPIKDLCWKERDGGVSSILNVCPHPDAGKEIDSGTRNPDRFYVEEEYDESGPSDDGWVGSDYDDNEEELADWIRDQVANM